MTVNHLLRLSRFESYQRHKMENKSARRGDRLLNDWVGENLAVVRVHCFPQLSEKRKVKNEKFTEGV